MIARMAQDCRSLLQTTESCDGIGHRCRSFHMWRLVCKQLSGQLVAPSYVRRAVSLGALNATYCFLRNYDAIQLSAPDIRRAAQAEVWLLAL